MTDHLPMNSLELSKVEGKALDEPRVKVLFGREIWEEAKAKKDKKVPKRKAKLPSGRSNKKAKKSENLLEQSATLETLSSVAETLKTTDPLVIENQATPDAEALVTEEPFYIPPEAEALMSEMMEGCIHDEVNKGKSTIVIRAEESLERARLGIVQEFIQHAVVKQCIEHCEGCKAGGDGIHTTCEQLFYDVWQNNPASIIRQMRMWDLMGRWYQFVQRHMRCLPEEVNRIYGVCCPSMMLYDLYNKLTMQPPHLECNVWKRVDRFVKDSVGNYKVCHFFIDMVARELVQKHD